MSESPSVMRDDIVVSQAKYIERLRKEKDILRAELEEKDKELERERAKVATLAYDEISRLRDEVTEYRKTIAAYRYGTTTRNGRKGRR